MSTPYRALSFDCGLRNLAVALVCVRPDFVFPPAFKTLNSADETNDAFKSRCLAFFLRCAWQLVHARLIDVSAFLGRAERVKNVKRLGLMSTAQALTGALSALELAWFGDGCLRPDMIAVEIQHNANADMKAVSLAISVFFMKTMTCGTTEYVGVTGGQKLKVCAALGVHEGDGAAAKPVKPPSKKAMAAAAKAAAAAATAASAATLAQFIHAPANSKLLSPQSTAANANVDDVTLTKQAAAAAATKPAWTRRGAFCRRGGGGRDAAKLKYEDNKQRTIAAMRVLCNDAEFASDAIPAALRELVTDHNIADALLQAVWVLWERWAPRVPTRPRKRKAISLDEM